MDYRKSHLHKDKGKDYHEAYLNEPYLKMVWQFEKGILDHILSTFYKGVEIHLLDFACGTGRILSYLEPRTKSAVGVDLSQSMLEVARKDIKVAEIIEADLTREDVLGDRKFNLITSFRFFPNAEKQLRMEAMQVLNRHLEKNGYLVFNNHKNTGSTMYRLARYFKRGGYRGMSISEVKTLLSENNLEIVKVYHIGVFPRSDKHIFLRPPFLTHIESLLAHFPSLSNLGENLVFICKRVHVR